MWAEPTIAEQLERTLGDARMRILVVGAGIGGSTFAALMRQRGLPVAVVERRPKRAPAGYMLGIMPLGGRVLHGLGLMDTYRERTIPMRAYALYDRHGELTRRYPLDTFVDRFGDLRSVERGVLLELLRGAAQDVLYEATVDELEVADDGVTAVFSDDSRARYDLVVIADGASSHTRSLAFAKDNIDTFDTGWGGFVLWCRGDQLDPTSYAELWADGWGVGVYPLPNGRAALFLAGVSETLVQTDPVAYAATLAERLPPDTPFATALGQLTAQSAPVYWPMRDGRARQWRAPGVVLLGDAAASFLPTAGVGASVAMDSAAALADELSRTDRAHLGLTLELYERRQRHRVERAQDNSRELARYMFVEGSIRTFARDQVMRFYTLEHMLSDIEKVMDYR